MFEPYMSALLLLTKPKVLIDKMTNDWVWLSHEANVTQSHILILTAIPDIVDKVWHHHDTPARWGSVAWDDARCLRAPGVDPIPREPAGRVVRTACPR